MATPRVVDLPAHVSPLPDDQWREAVKELVAPNAQSAGAGPRVFVDVTGHPLVIDDNLFKHASGDFKTGEKGHRMDPRVFALAITDPDEVWLDFEPLPNDPTQGYLRRRYMARFILSGSANMAVLAVFQLTELEWSGVTLFAPQVDRSAASQLRQIETRGRSGQRVYTRP